MLHLAQSLRSGEVTVKTAPAALPSHSNLLIRSCCTLVSAGTERMLLDFGRGGWVEKVRQQPEKVRMVLEKIQTDGLLATVESVRAKLDQPLAIGYCNAGTVMEVSSGVTEFASGDRVASNGAHAQVVSVPKNLCARIPNCVSDEAAAFTALGAVALQGIRLAEPTLGETFAVMGVGLIGLMAVQILRANGCQILAIEPNPRRLELACQFGAQPASPGDVVDGVLITAATRSSQPVHQAAAMCRNQGRIVLVGVTGLELSRDDFYKKELSFRVSCSYGPGRYDPAYEEKGQDYPLGFVRWTAQRNFEAVLGLMAEGKLDVAPLITHRFPFEHAEEAYELLVGGEPHLGILLEYPEKPAEELLTRTIYLRRQPRPVAGTPKVAVLGAGGYAAKVLLPALQNCESERKVIASSNGISAAHAGRKFGFAEATTDVEALIARADVDTVVIATRHDSHARLACQALNAGKHVFVEKPLAVNEEELAAVEAAVLHAPTLLMVGFNRRFSPHIVKAKQQLAAVRQPKAIIITVNAGTVPAGHWTQDPYAGGGRIIGEACHFIDLARFLAGTPVRSVETTKLSGDTVTISLGYEDGSIATIHYLANGSKAFPKERVEIFCGGRILQLDNFRTMRGYGWPGFGSMRLWRQDKGNAACLTAFIQAIRNGQPSPIPVNELFEVARTTLKAAQ